MDNKQVFISKYFNDTSQENKSEEKNEEVSRIKNSATVNSNKEFERIKNQNLENSVLPTLNNSTLSHEISRRCFIKKIDFQKKEIDLEYMRKEIKKLGQKEESSVDERIKIDIFKLEETEAKLPFEILPTNSCRPRRNSKKNEEYEPEDKTNKNNHMILSNEEIVVKRMNPRRECRNTSAKSKKNEEKNINVNEDMKNECDMTKSSQPCKNKKSQKESTKIRSKKEESILTSDSGIVLEEKIPRKRNARKLKKVEVPSNEEILNKQRFNLKKRRRKKLSEEAINSILSNEEIEEKSFEGISNVPETISAEVEIQSKYFKMKSKNATTKDNEEIEEKKINIKKLKSFNRKQKKEESDFLFPKKNQNEEGMKILKLEEILREQNEEISLHKIEVYEELEEENDIKLGSEKNDPEEVEEIKNEEMKKIYSLWYLPCKERMFNSKSPKSSLEQEQIFEENLLHIKKEEKTSSKEETEICKFKSISDEEIHCEEMEEEKPTSIKMEVFEEIEELSKNPDNKINLKVLKFDSKYKEEKFRKDELQKVNSKFSLWYLSSKDNGYNSVSPTFSLKQEEEEEKSLFFHKNSLKEETEICKGYNSIFEENLLHIKKEEISSVSSKEICKIKSPPDEEKFFNLPSGSQTPLWSPPKSPHNLIEESLYKNPWALLVATIFLNKTSCYQARPCIEEFLKVYTSPEEVLKAKPEEFEKYFEKIGLKKRAVQIWRMSHDFLYKKWRKASELHGIGKYGNDAFEMFCRGNMEVEPTDRFLKIYKAWNNMVQKTSTNYNEEN